MKKEYQHSVFFWIAGIVSYAIYAPSYAANMQAQKQPAPASSATPLAVAARIDVSHPGAQIPESFLGISVEYGSIRRLFAHPNLTATVRLLKRLGDLQGPPVLRIGGNSEDRAIWHLSAWHPRPIGDSIDLSNRVAGMLHAAAVQTGSQLILGINFGRGTAVQAKPWIRAAIRDIGISHIKAFEIGNEPDIYNHHGTRPRSYTVQDYFRQWNAFADAVEPLLPRQRLLAGPAFCASWRRYTPEFIQQQHRRLAIVTMHEYPLGAPIKDHRSPRYADIANLLKNSSATIFSKLIRTSIVAGRRYNTPIRFAEINSAYAGGKPGVSNVFGAALWSLDTMFEIASSGSAGVNFHMGPRYGAFWSFQRDEIHVLPLYYGMLIFAQAAPPGSELIPVRFHTRANIKIWMTLDRHHIVRIVLINKDLHQSVTVGLKLPGSKRGQLERLTARSVFSQNHIDIGGLTFAGSENGVPNGRQHVTTVPSQKGRFAIRLGRCSAALLTVPLSPSAVLKFRDSVHDADNRPAQKTQEK